MTAHKIEEDDPRGHHAGRFEDRVVPEPALGAILGKAAVRGIKQATCRLNSLQLRLKSLPLDANASRAALRLLHHLLKSPNLFRRHVAEPRKDGQIRIPGRMRPERSIHDTVAWLCPPEEPAIYLMARP